MGASHAWMPMWTQVADYDPQDCHHGGQSCLGVYMDTSASDINLGSKYDLNHIFAIIEQDENEIYPPTPRKLLRINMEVVY